MRRLSMAKRAEGAKVALVPTMGALHEGHLSLVRIAVTKADFVIVSIFVNPIQFGPSEDYSKYPRELEEDARKLDSLGAHVIFTPDNTIMYPPEHSTYVSVEGLTEELCGRSRPVHFKGVATVVTKLFNIVMPHLAVFGQKDAQQLAVIRRLVTDLNMDVEIVQAPIVREPDGLAMSSRNSYLSKKEREQASVIYKALCAGEKLAESGVVVSSDIINEAHKILGKAPLAKTEYIEIADIDDMSPVDDISGGAILAVAVWIGKTRLIDNVLLNK